MGKVKETAALSIDGALFAGGPVVVFRWRPGGERLVEAVTGSVRDVFGHPPEAFAGGAVRYADLIHPDDRAAALGAAKAGATYRIRHADGSVRWVEESAPVDGCGRGPMSTVVDVTARRAVEAELARRDAIQAMLNAVATRLFAAPDWTAVIGDALKTIGEAVGADRVHLFETVSEADGRRSGRLRFEWTAPGVTPQIDNPAAREMALGRAATERWERALGEGRVLQALARDLSEAERPLVEALDVRAVLMVPIFVGPAWWGAVGFVDAGTDRRWEAVEIQVLTVVAGVLGAAIGRARHEKALSDGEARLMGAVESLQEEVALFDAADRLVLCNSAFRRRNPLAEQALAEGWTYESLLRATLNRGVLVEARGREEVFLEERLRSHHDPGEPILRTFADGTTTLIKESRTPEGGIALTFADVTLLQRANAELEAAKTEAETARALLQDALESTTEAFALYDAEGRLVIFNKAYRDTLYRHSPDLLAPGVRFEDILRERLRRGMVPDLAEDPEDWVRRRLGIFFRAAGSIERAFPGGTWWKMNEQRTANGGIAQIATDITDIKAREAALEGAKTEAEAARALLQDALASLSDAFALFDGEGRLVVFNQAWAALFADSPDLVKVGALYADLLRERGRRGLTPDFTADPEGWMRWRMDVFWNEKGPIERIFPNGSWWRFIEKRTMGGGVAQIATDITAIKAREEALRESETRFRTSFERTAIGAAIVGMGVDARYRMVNAALCDMLGYGRGELLTMSPLDVTHPDDVADGRRLLDRFAAGAADTFVREKRYIRRDGGLVWAIVSGALIRDADGRPAYSIRHVQDISERKRAEEASARLQAELTHVSRVRTMGEMATGFAHELNQPLTAIANYAQGGLRRHRSGAIGIDEMAHVLELVAAQAYRAGDIIRRIRRFVQKETPEIGAVAVNTAIREAVGLVGSEALRHDVTIGLDLADALPAVQADAVQLQQVILNLARNGIEAIGETAAAGGLELTTRQGRGGVVEILVTDTGPGIDAAVQSAIFDPFFTTKPAGMGMGLPICRSIIESFGGSLALVGSRPGETTFAIRLKPALIPSMPAAPAAEPSNA